MEDLAGIGKAAEKLLDAISKGIGALYKPRAIRREADAKAYETLVVGNAAVEIEASKRRLASLNEVEQKILIAEADRQIADRARERFSSREIERQRNIENIAEAAFEQVEGITGTSDPVDADWCRRFFNIAEDVSDISMQTLWSKILAGEVIRPKSYSIRTLNVLRDLTPDEAAAFEILCNLCFDDGFLVRSPVSDPWQSDWLKAFGLTYEKLLALQEAGLIHDAESNSPYTAVWNSVGAATLMIAVRYQDKYVRFTTLAPKEAIELTTIRLTSAGMQLSRLIKKSFNKEFIEYVAAKYEMSVEILPESN